ncbi:hypothetical protein BBP40_000559 [Aspergillus hancockii]|nr:hypothetical protein BBP40_000559 [Aspergillus hancockii]
MHGADDLRDKYRDGSQGDPESSLSLCIQLPETIGLNLHIECEDVRTCEIDAENDIWRMKKTNTLDVDVFCVTYRHHCVHSRFFRHGSMVIQFTTTQLWSAITGTRPGVLLPQKASLGDTSLGKHRRGLTFQSDLLKHVSVDGLPASVCYSDIELFYLKDPGSKHDALCAIVEFRNLKGLPEGADG